MASDRLWGDRDTKVVVLDTSAILMLFEFSIKLEDELAVLVGKSRIILPRQVVDELKLLSARGDGRKTVFARASLKMLSKYNVEEIEAENADTSVLNLAKKYNGIIVTNDRELRKKAKEERLSVIFLRGKGKLVLE
ncbi:MAG: hypothetical protein DRN33_05225 [Thermoplasmata archaeon]|nr:MAG: hypothetical protein DRN33_05225 [Thermoplasmata archaeon]